MQCHASCIVTAYGRFCRQRLSWCSPVHLYSTTLTLFSALLRVCFIMSQAATSCLSTGLLPIYIAKRNPRRHRKLQSICAQCCRMMEAAVLTGGPLILSAVDPVRGVTTWTCSTCWLVQHVGHHCRLPATRGGGWHKAATASTSTSAVEESSLECSKYISTLVYMSSGNSELEWSICQ